ncbi:MAG: phosphotransferase [Proteobacteria bacterium]|nr:phosphotransferase [Pseudomonadota bacterium]
MHFHDSLRKVLASSLDNYDRLIACERLSGGANQETYRIIFSDREGRENKLALRRAAGGSQASQEAINVGLATEARLFQIARDANVPSPEVLRVLNPEDGLGDGFIMEWLDGETLGSRIVKAPELDDIRPRLAGQCGRILARIHAIDISTNKLTEMLNTVSPAENVEDTWARYRELDTPQPMIDYTARWLLDHLPNNPRMCLVHNDFRNGNLMIDASGIIGVLDWEIAHLGDPMRDLGWLCTNSWRFGRSDLPVGGFGDYAELINAYERESEIKVDREHLRFWEVFGSFWWAVGCLRMAQQYRDGPDRTVERPAIGRRSSECQVDCVNLLMPGPVDIVVSADSVNDENLPRTEELIDSVAAFLINDVAAATDGRIKFLSRVASNSLQIVKRELTCEGTLQVSEHHGLQVLFQCEDSLGALRWRLVNALRDGQLELDNEVLTSHLRHVTVNRLAVDQPKYSGFKTAIEHLT